jgi:multidrug transporter EmrE-like cation transporter
MRLTGMRWLFELLALGALWGGSYVFIRVAAPVVGPAPLVWLRVMIATVALSPLLYLAIRRGLRAPRRFVPRLLLLAAVNAALPFTLIAAAEVHMAASLAAILNATTALFTAVISAVLFGERLGAARLGALVVGLSGVGLVVGWSEMPSGATGLLAAGGCMVAALCYAFGTIYAGRGFVGVPPDGDGVRAAGGVGGAAPGPGRSDHGLGGPRPQGGAVHRRPGPALDGGRLPAVLPAGHHDRTDPDLDGHVPRPLLRGPVRRALPRRARRVGHDRRRGAGRGQCGVDQQGRLAPPGSGRDSQPGSDDRPLIRDVRVVRPCRNSRARTTP